MSNRECSTNHNPLCATIIFFAGSVLGAYAGHTAGVGNHDFVVIGVSTVVFYLTQAVLPKRLHVSKIK